jgi:uncharacterized protein (DUF427 family)
MMARQMATTDQRPIKQPGPDHPITIEPSTRRVRVAVAGAIVADSGRALILREKDYEPVYYVPPEDVDFSLLTPSDHTSYCPYKGEAAYYSVPAGGGRSVNAAWQYRDAYPAVSEIGGYLAFYPSRVDSIG